MNRQVLIADDEYFIRQKLKKIIPWQKLQLDFCGEAENGLEVLKLLATAPCDILLLDIHMPKMDGLRALQEIKELYPKLTIIIISGFNDFEYARTAIRFGVTDYLLKPVDANGLELSLINSLKHIALRNSQENKNKQLLHYEKCTLLANIRKGMVPMEHLCQLDDSFSKQTYSLYIGAYMVDELPASRESFVNLLHANGCLCEYSKESEYIYVFQIFLQAKAQSERLGALITEFLQQQDGYTFLSIGKLFSLDEDWQSYYKRCIYLLNHRYFSAESDMALEHTPQPKQNFTQELTKIRQNISRLINGQNETAFTTYLDELFGTIARRKCVEFLHLIVMELFMNYHIHNFMEQQSQQNINTFFKGFLDEEYTLLNLKSACLFYGLLCIQKNETTPSDVALSNKITSFIKQYFSSPDLSVAQLADVFQLNSSYLGNVFKKTNQISILQYITQIRMDAATELLHSGAYKISEIAKMVGYSDVFYFSKKFKKTFGYSPKDYAATLTSQSGEY